MATDMQNLSAVPAMNGQMKRFIFPIPSIPMPNMGRSTGIYINRTFTYWSLSAGLGLVVMGSILTYIFQDKSSYSRDPFRSSLQVTSIIFIIIGVILITSSLIKIAAMIINNNESDSNQSCLCFPDDSSDNDVKNTPPMPENTIVYNPFYPPILVPYNISNAQFPGNEISEYFHREPNFSYLPGSLFVAEDQEKKKGVTEGEPLTESQYRADIFVLENRHKEAEEEEEEDIVETTVEDEDQKNNTENYKTEGGEGNPPPTRY